MSSLQLIHELQTHHAQFHPVVPFRPAHDKLVLLDFTASNKVLTPDLLHDTPSFVAYINREIRKAGARYGIGGYAENRTVYAGSPVFDAVKPGAIPRRVHLGMDIWGKPYTAVMAPLDALIHSYANNDRIGDYGATIILSHTIGRMSFYTLYGHLSLNSIKDAREGNRIQAGEVFAEFGIPAENGHWPPHLHFQIITEMGNRKGDYPGVCADNEKEQYLANSPDPDIILQMNRYLG